VISYSVITFLIADIRDAHGRLLSWYSAYERCFKSSNMSRGHVLLVWQFYPNNYTSALRCM